jgi:hypothetical protein
MPSWGKKQARQQQLGKREDGADFMIDFEISFQSMGFIVL